MSQDFNSVPKKTMKQNFFVNQKQTQNNKASLSPWNDKEKSVNNNQSKTQSEYSELGG